MGLYGFFRYRAVNTGRNAGISYIPLTDDRIDSFLYYPVIAEMWKQHEVWDGTYTVDDLINAHIILDLKTENTIRLRESAGNKS